MAQNKMENVDDCEPLDGYDYLVSEDFLIDDTSEVLKKRVGPKITFQGNPPTDRSQDHLLFKSEVRNNAK